MDLYFGEKVCPYVPASEVAVMTCIAEGGILSAFYGANQLNPFGACCPADAFATATAIMAAGGTLVGPFVYNDPAMVCTGGTDMVPRVGIVVAGMFWCLGP